MSEFDYFDQAPVGYLTLDTQGVILTANRTFANWLEAEKADLIGLPLAYFVVAEDQEQYRLQFSRLIGIVAECRVLVRLFSTTGRQIWLRLDLSLLPEINVSQQIHVIACETSEQVSLEAELRERLKELSCLYSISDLGRQPGLSLDELLAWAVELIPQSWQFPELTAARISLNEKRFQTAGFRSSCWNMVEDIVVNEKIAGRIEVAYLVDCWSHQGTPFLQEERHLLSAVATELGRIVERIWAKDAQQESERLLKLAQVVARVGYFSLDIATGTWEGSSVLNSIFGIGDDFVRDVAHWEQMIAPEHRTLMMDRLREVLQHGLRWDVEYKLIRQDNGQERWLSAKGEFDYDSAGVPIRLSGFIQDITERKLVEETLRQREAMLSRTEAIAQLGSWELDTVTNRLLWSDEVYRIFGLRPQESPVTYEDFLTYVHPDDRVRLHDSYQHSIRQGCGHYELEHRIVRQDNGEIRQVIQRCEHLQDSAGRIVRAVGMIQDITARKKMEIRQQIQRQTLEQLACGASLHTVLSDLIEGLEQELTGAMAAVMLFDKQQQELYFVAGKKLPRTFTAALSRIEIGPELCSCGRAAYFKERVTVEDIQVSPYWEKHRELAQKNGLAACSSEPILAEDGEVLGTLTVYFSLPIALKPEETQLIHETSHWAGIAIKNRIQQEKLQILSLTVEQSPAAVVITDPAGNITYVNQKFTAVSGYEFTEAIGQNPRVLKTAKTPPEVFADLWKTITAGGVWQGEFVNRKKNGEHYWERALINPILNDEGTITHFLAIKEDITEFKLSQQALQQAKEEAEHANRMKSAFVANVSHEIRTPMNAILGFTEMLMRDTSLSPQQLQYLQTIATSGEHLLELINDVLEMSKIESGRTTLQSGEFNLQLLLADLKNMFQRKVNEKSLQFSIETQASVPTSIIADKQKFRQILINVIGNAVKFTQSGKVTVRLWTGPNDQATGKLRLFTDVEDTGPGIAAAEMGQLFRIFSQTASGVARGGTGLGLAISRNFARMMGGDITVSSQLGKGSCFHVEILAEPGCCEADEPFPELKVVGLAPGQKTYRILIVDDEALNRQILASLFNKIGIDSSQAVDGEQAIGSVAECEPDLILMDIQMPKLDGYEATRRIKALSHGRDIPIIGLSAGVFEQDRFNALACGMDAFISKPFKSQELLQTIAEFLPLRYLYDAAMSPLFAGTVKPESLQAELAKIPADLIEQLHEKADGADYFALMSDIDRLEAYSSALAGYLRELARRYDYEACTAVLTQQAG